ncbi:MAG: class II histone deacetylase [Thermomicrobiales bacterium]
MAGEAKAGLVFSHRYTQHNTNPYRMRSGERLPFVEQVDHMSNPRLIDRTMHLVDLSGLSDHVTHIEPYLASEEAILSCHTPELLNRVKEADAAGDGDAGRGSPVRRGSYDIARLAAGGVMAAVDAVMAGDVRRAYALVRPPGHHATPDMGMGFCIFNNVSIAARHARRQHGVGRILIVDWDVHHGNGTHTIFYDDPNTLFVSLHQTEVFPVGSGLIEEVGEGEGVGRTINLPLPAGSGTATYIAALEEIVIPIARQFAPELILLSCGQDASNSDPLSRMCLTTGSYRRMTQMMMDLADECCDGRLVAAQEGGYAEIYAPYCTLAIIETLAGYRSSLEEPMEDDLSLHWPQTTKVGLDARAALDAIRAQQSQYWQLP